MWPKLFCVSRAVSYFTETTGLSSRLNRYNNCIDQDFFHLPTLIHNGENVNMYENLRFHRNFLKKLKIIHCFIDWPLIQRAKHFNFHMWAFPSESECKCPLRVNYYQFLKQKSKQRYLPFLAFDLHFKGHFDIRIWGQFTLRGHLHYDSEGKAHIWK